MRCSSNSYVKHNILAAITPCYSRQENYQWFPFESCCCCCFCCYTLVVDTIRKENSQSCDVLLYITVHVSEMKKGLSAEDGEGREGPVVFTFSSWYFTFRKSRAGMTTTLEVVD